MSYVKISQAAYERMLDAEGVAVMTMQRQQLFEKNLKLAAQIKENNWKITGLTASIAALKLYEGG